MGGAGRGKKCKREGGGKYRAREGDDLRFARRLWADLRKLTQNGTIGGGKRKTYYSGFIMTGVKKGQLDGNRVRGFEKP